MNIQPNDIITDAIQAASPEEWKNFFEEARQQDYQRLRAVPENQLTGLQERVKLLDEIENLFVSIRQGTNQNQ